MRCIICGSHELERIQKGVRDNINCIVVKCKHCSHLQLDRSSTIEQMRIKSAVENMRRLAWIQKYKELPCRILDIGCGYGWFMDAATSIGCVCTGVDINQQRIEYTSQSHKCYKAIDDITENTFDAIVLIHSLEHLASPIQYLQELSVLLNNRGLLFVEVPNANDKMLHICRAYELYWYQEQHNSYFTKHTLTLLAKRAGFQIVDVVGYQRYGVKNKEHWLRTGLPQVMPDLEDAVQYITGDKLETDTLLLVLRRPLGK